MAQIFKKLEIDSTLTGVVMGIALPIATFYVNYLIHFNGMHLYKVFIAMKRGQMEFPLYTFCLLPSLCMFFLFLWLNKERASRGVLITVLPYVIFMVWKFSTE